MNHAGPSLTTISHKVPLLNYNPEVYHKEEHLFQIRILEKNMQSVMIYFEKAKRYLVTLGADDQELNQGTFMDKGKLFGLKKPLSTADIESIGLDNLANHISSENGFLTAVREYRTTDFGGLCCGNIFASHEAGVMSTEEFKKALENVMNLIRKCRTCIERNKDCRYKNLNEQCEACKENGEICVSLSQFHFLWDMAGTQRGTAEQSLINPSSSSSDFID